MASEIPRNTAQFSLQELMDATGATLQSGSCESVMGVSTDTRTVRDGGLFVALAGEKFDGHKFAQKAVDEGARALLVERSVQLSREATEGVAVLRVSSTLRALGTLGQLQRLRWGGPVVAVAGSVGKTTTRSTVAALFTAMGCVVHCPPGNLNNRVGVPLVLLGLTPEHTTAVVELGTSLPGEVAMLVEMALPNIAILTRISIEHSEGLGDLDAIEYEEGAVLRGLKGQALAVVNADDERCLRQLSHRNEGRAIVYGMRVRGVNANTGNEGPAGQLKYDITRCDVVSADVTRVTVTRPNGTVVNALSPLLGTPGAYALTASLAAVEASLQRSITASQLETALASSQLGEPGRLSPIELSDGSLILDDTYNSSPASVLSSAQVARSLAQSRKGRLILLLGEMRELGDASRQLHTEVGQQLKSFGASVTVAFGGDAQFFLPPGLGQCSESCFEEDPLDAVARFAETHQPGDVILVKSSRGLRAERIVQQIVEKIGTQS